MRYLSPSVVHDYVFEISPASELPVWEGTGCAPELRKVNDLTTLEVNELRVMHGRLAATYLRTIYRSPETYVLLIRKAGNLVGVLWVVPGIVMRRRYPFVRRDVSAIISCVISPSCRGMGLYPRGIAQVAGSGLAQNYLIWAHDSNTASLRGIEKAGGRKVGNFTRKRWLRGLIAKIEYRGLND